jgi:predicted TIM-barrel fold metal-dependent hydrolase
VTTSETGDRVYIEHNYRIFDLHSHVNEGLVKRALPDGGYDVADDVAYRLGIMRRANVRACGLMANHVYERPEGIVQTRQMNDFVAWYRDSHRDVFPVAIGGVEPIYGVRVAGEEIRRMATELRLDGVVWHHHFHGTDVDEPRMYALIEELEKRQLPAFLHFNGDSLQEQYPGDLEPLARAFPNVTFVALCSLHSGSSIYAIRRLADRCANVMLDTSFLRPIGRQIEALSATIGADRLIFGTDMVPYASHIYQVQPGVLDIVESERLSEDDKRKIFWGNAERLFPALKDVPERGPDRASVIR